MKKLLILISAVTLCLCSCQSDDTVPPKLTVPEAIRHSQGEVFDINTYAEVTDDSEVSVTYEGEVNVGKLGDYDITVIAEDEAGNSVKKKASVSVQKNRRKYSNAAICQNVRDYIFDLQANGHDNIAFRGYSQDIGFFSCAYSANPAFLLGEYPGELCFETVQYEDYKASVFNVIFYVRSDAMWYWPTAAELQCGGEIIEIELMETGEKNGMYGYYATIDELNEKKDKTSPDFGRIERLKAFAGSADPVVLKCYNDRDFFEYELTEANRRDFADMLMVYEELMTYY